MREWPAERVYLGAAQRERLRLDAKSPRAYHYRFSTLHFNIQSPFFQICIESLLQTRYISTGPQRRPNCKPSQSLLIPLSTPLRHHGNHHPGRSGLSPSFHCRLHLEMLIATRHAHRPCLSYSSLRSGIPQPRRAWLSRILDLNWVSLPKVVLAKRDIES